MSNIFKTTLVAMIVLGLWSCKTTQRYAKIDPVKKSGVLLSSGDKRATLSDAEQSRSVGSSIEALQNKLQRDPSNVSSRLNLAKLLMLQDRLDQANKECEKVLRVDTKNTDAKKVLAEIAFRRGNYELSSILLNGLGGASSKDSDILNLMALLALNEKNPSTALGLFKAALQRDPGNMAVRMNLGVLYLKHRQLNEAAAHFERVLRVMPDHVDAKLHLAVIKGAKGETKLAESMFREVQSAASNNPLVLFNLAVFQKNQKQYKSAMATVKRYLQTPQVGSSNPTEAFELVNELQSLQEDPAERLTDQEIHALTEKNRKESATQKAARSLIDDEDATNEPAVPSAVTDEIDALEKELLD